MTHSPSVREYELRLAGTDEREHVVAHVRREHETALIHDTGIELEWVLFVEGTLVGMFPRRGEAIAGLARFAELRSELIEIAIRATDHARHRSTNPMYYGEEGFYRPLPTLASGIVYARGLYLLFSPAIDRGDGHFPGTSDLQEAVTDLVGLFLNEIYQRFVDSLVQGWTMIDEMESVISFGLQAERLHRDVDAQVEAIIDDVMRRMG